MSAALLLVAGVVACSDDAAVSPPDAGIASRDAGGTVDGGAGAADAGAAAPDGGVPAAIQALAATLAQTDPSDYADAVEQWVDGQDRIPIVDGQRALFVWRGTDEDVRMVGDATAWSISESPRLVPLNEYPGAGLLYLEQVYESDARLDYKLVVGRTAWNLDPLNPRTIAGGFGPNSELAMPDYRTPAIAVTDGAVATGTTTLHTFDSTALGDQRHVRVYVPAGADVPGERSLVIFHDGRDYLQLIPTRIMLDRMVTSGQIAPLVAAFATPNDRVADYSLNARYADFLADELVPWVRANYNAGLDPAKTGTFGPSMGGLAACFVALERPDVFKLGACQSGAFTVNDDALINRVMNSRVVDVKLHLVVGTYETRVGSVANLLEAQRRMVAALEAKGYEHSAEEHPQGHSWGLWRDRLPAAFLYLWGQ